mmetsp:Transcript_30344/g.28987  ORF Transcript_30344/g.28987 Transcript_30344/m.28987 type:complete len:352 (-) Transcript_30344:327-1382(-)
MTTIDLDTLMGTLESSNRTRNRPLRVMGKKCPLCDNEELLITKDRLCRTCGEELIEIIEPITTITSEGRDREESVNFFDLLGDDLRNAIQASMAQALPDRQISVEYLSSLGKVTLDNRRGLLYDIVIHLGPLTIMGIIASFGPLPQKEMTASLIIGDPEFGEKKMDNNCTNAMVLLKRGKVSFAAKAITAQNSGASALLICQNSDMWPFVMTDNSNELSSIEIKIPIIMISQRDSILLERLLDKNNSQKKYANESSIEKNSTATSKSELLQCKLVCGRFEEECSICQENMMEGNIVLKLSCRHAYHTQCVQTWLERQNTCPMCRNEMPVHTGPPKKQPGSEPTAQNMPYFN